MEKSVYFSKCKTLDEVKQTYKFFALINHPSRGGDKNIMSQISQEYREVIKDPLHNFLNYSQEDQDDFIKFPEIIYRLIGLNVGIELCGNWIWLSGKNTFDCRKQLKKLGFMWSPNKLRWYLMPKAQGSFKRVPKSMDYIRAKFGSDTVVPSKSSANNRPVNDSEKVKV